MKKFSTTEKVASLYAYITVFQNRKKHVLEKLIVATDEIVLT